MKLKLAAFVVAAAAMALPAHAADEIKNIPIEAVKALPEYQAQIGDFKFGFGGGGGNGLGASQSRKATATIGKGKDKACAWAALSALIAMKNDALSRGGSSITGIKSTTTGAGLESATEIQCLVGFTNARVALIGNVQK